MSHADTIAADSPEAVLLRHALCYSDSDTAGVPMPLGAPCFRQSFQRLAEAGFGEIAPCDRHRSIFVDASRPAPLAFTPSQKARDWLKVQPVHADEITLLRYFSHVGISDDVDLDPHFPEFTYRVAAHALSVRGFGAYHPHAKPDVDPYFVISDAGRAFITQLAAA